MKIKINKTLAGFALLLITQVSYTQQSVVSPYSRYALGSIGQNTLTPYLGMGGASVALCDSFFVNPSNPASYSFLIRHRPVFDVGTIGYYTRFESNTTQESNRTFALKNFVLGLPVAKKWGIGLGLMPFSSIGYSIKYSEIIQSFGTVRYDMSGNGGINRLFTGISVMLLDNNTSKISMGTNASYLFGNSSYTRKAFMPPTTGVYNTKIENTRFIKGFLYETGIIYTGKIKPRINFISGATLQLPGKITSSQEFLAYTFINQNTEAIVDTVNYKITEKGKIFIPKELSFSAGLEFFSKSKNKSEKQSRYLIVSQYSTKEWDRYYEEFDGIKTDSILNKSLCFSLGMQFTPFHNITTGNNKLKIWEVSTYKMGIRYGNTGLQLNNNEIKEYGISFGLTIPIFNSMSLSTLNFAVETGKRGTINNNLIMENYVIYNIGISFIPHRNDVWFFKRKYD